MLMPLDMLRAGEWAEVAEVTGQPAWVGRLAELGIRQGCRVQVVQPGSPSCSTSAAASSACAAGSVRKSSSARCRDARAQRTPPGRPGRGRAVTGEPGLVQRLYEFGLLEGEKVELIALAPLGDPIEIRLGNTRLSLRKVRSRGHRRASA